MCHENFPRPSCNSRHAFTLAEMMISTIVLAFLIVVMGTGMTLLLREGENNRNLMASGGNGAASASAQAATARSAVDTLDADLKVATFIKFPAPGEGFQLSLTVPARCPNHTSESIIYQWNGPGTPLTRQLNANPAVSIADNVQILNLAPIPKTVGPPAPTAGAEPPLIAHDGGSAASVQPVTLSQTSWVSQYVSPSLPASAVSWGITHVKLQLRPGASPTSGLIQIQLFSADADQHPLGTLGSATVDASMLSAAAGTWTDIAISASGLSPANGVCVVVSTSAGTSPASILDDTAAADPGMSFSVSGDGGATWTTATSPPALQIQVYGTVTQ